MSYNGATATWSGYNHQGKVGLFVALQEMARMISGARLPDGADVPAMFGAWCLEFEGAEDFDICKIPLGDGVGSVDSRHQVKAYNTSDAKKIKKYEDVLVPSMRKVKLKDGTEKEVPVGFKIKVTDAKGVDLGQIVPVGKRFLHVIQDVKNWEDSGVANQNEVWRYSYPDGDGGQKPYCSLSKTYGSNDAINRCPLFKTVAEQIKTIDPSNYSETRAVMVWQQLQAQLQNMVASAHVTKTRACFRFVQIYQIIIAGGGVENWNQDRIKRKIQYEWERIQESREGNNEDFDVNYARAKDWIEDLLLKRNDSEFKEAVDRLRPHQQDAPDLDIDGNGFRYVVHEVIKRVEQCLPSSEGPHYNYYGQRYYLTTISDENIGNDSKVVARHVLEGINAKADDYFHQGKIITRHLSNDFEELVQPDEFSGSGMLGGVKVGKLTEIAPKSLITTEVAINELNQES